MTSASQAKPEKSYLAAAVESISPWSSSRSSTPKPATVSTNGPELASRKGHDHTLNHRNGVSSKRYPQDCPPLNARWFYAVDVPKRKPKLLKETPKDSKPLPQAKKFAPFSANDSKSIEIVFQQLLEEEEEDNNGINHSNKARRTGVPNVSADGKENTSMNEAGNLKDAGGKACVKVNEDFLFDVDIEARELAPVYWLGPIYEVRRGSWFYQEGSTLRPCEENLATQLEEGYLKVKPFRYPKSLERPISDATSMKPGNDPESLALPPLKGESPNDVTPKPSISDLKAASAQINETAAKEAKEVLTPPEPQTHRLFGTYMNSIVTYQDEATAWLSSDGIMSRVSSTVYQRFAGGGYMGGVKIIRGYIEPGKVTKIAEAKSDQPATPSTSIPSDVSIQGLQLDEKQRRILKRRSAPPSSIIEIDDDYDTKGSKPPGPQSRESLLKRQISSMVIDSMDPEKGEEAVRRRDEKEIQTDYVEHDGEDQAREIEHLILVTHGIGQRLGMKTESVNFVHDVNVLRQNLKNVYSTSEDLQALNAEVEKLPKNCRIQVLPVCWRHLLDFPRKGLKQSRREHDLGDTLEEDEEYPSLEDITVEGIPFVRSLISDLALDILLYQSAYREHISSIVLRECNRIYKLFLDRNPYFDGRVSLIGHSLGSAILFDLLCRQKEDLKLHGSNQQSKHYHSRAHSRVPAKKDENNLSLDFAVEDLYCLGSPVGLFQMLKGRTIAARQHPGAFPAESPLNLDDMDDPFLGASNPTSIYSTGERISPITGLPYTISSPKCSQLYNIFHPSDPISYRLEPLIAPTMSSLKPQALPYTKRSIFGANQGLTGIGVKVGQSMSGFWSSLNSGIASSILNRSLGLTGKDVASMVEPQNSTVLESQLSAGTGTSISGDGEIFAMPPLVRQYTEEKKRQLAKSTAAADRDGIGSNAPTLIDDEIETLFSGFQKRRNSAQVDDEQNQHATAEAEENEKKLRREETKVRGLNQNGRVDFIIQESYLDFNAISPISAIASHLGYWADEDVSHFMMSQLLSRHRKNRRKRDSKHSRSNPL